MASTGINFIGTAANESVDGSELNDTLDGAGGNDTLRGLGGDDSLVGGDGHDSLSGGNGRDSLYGGKGNDTLLGDSGDDWLDADAGNDLLEGGAGSDTLHAGADNDTLHGGAANDWLLRDRNWLSYQNFLVPVLVDLMLGTGSASVHSQALADIHIVIGGTGNDTLLGFQRTLSNGIEEVDIVEEWAPDAGDDSVDGRGGLDVLRYDLNAAAGSVNVDLAAGTASDGLGGLDVFTDIEAVYGTAFGDVLVGSDRTDVAETFRGGAGADSIDGRLGQDIVDYQTAPAAVFIDLADGSGADGSGSIDVLMAIEGVIGSPFDDTIIGASTSDATLYEGGAGNDTIDGSAGSNDEASYEHSPYGGVFADLVAELATQDGWGNGDALVGIEHITGTLLFDDTIYGSAFDNRLRGLGGYDSLSGTYGNDTLLGGSGSDTLVGGEDDDELYADDDSEFSDDFYNDYLYGGEGNDTLNAGWYDYLTGGDGDDLFIVGGEYATLDYSATPGRIHVTLGNVNSGLDGSVLEETDSIPGFDSSDAVRGVRLTIHATSNGDLLEGADGPAFDYDAAYRASDNFLAGSGDDTVLGLAGYDTLSGEHGNDSILGGEDDDQLDGGDGNDTVDGGNGYDIVFGGFGEDSIFGGGGNDVLNYEYSGLPGVDVNLGAGTVDKDGEVDNVVGIETVIGSQGDDSFIGSSATEQFSGRAGNDTFDGSGGVDIIDYLDSNIPSGSGVVVTLPSDSSVPGSANDGRGGTDTIIFGSAEQLFASYGPDLVFGADAGVGDSIWGSNGDDTLRGRSGDDVLFGEQGNDVLDGGAGNDTLLGGDGDDHLAPGIGSNSVGGNSGTDTVSYAEHTGALVIDLSGNLVTRIDGSDTLSDIEAAIGGSGNDRFFGNAGANWFLGNAGNDSFEASAGVDTLSYDDSTLVTGVVVTLPSTTVPGSASDGHGGSDTIHLGAAEVVIGSAFADSITGADVTVFGAEAVGHDALIGGAGNDTLGGLAGNDSLDAGDGDDRLVAGGGFDTLDGGAGNDLAVAGFARTATVIEVVGADLRVNRSGIDTLLLASDNGDPTIENVQFSDLTVSYAVLLSQAGEFLTGTGSSETLTGGAGWDSIVGLGGNDLLTGNAGNDTLVAGEAADTADGGDGTDLAVLPAPLAQYIVSRSGADLLLARGSDSLLLPANVEDVRFSDVTRSFAQLLALSGAGINGTSGNDTLVGGTGQDSLNGLGGDDLLDGAAGDDRLDGGDGNDRLVPGDGNDTLIGGSGFDLASYADATGGVTVDLSANTVAKPGFGDVLVGVEAAIGSAGADAFTGGPDDNLFIGAAGNDSFFASAGVDTISYDDPAIAPGTGVTVTLPSSASSNGTASDGRGGVDTIVLGAAEVVIGSAGPDSIQGAPAGVHASVAFGHDTLIGGAGNDTLQGLSGNDSLLGGDADDRLIPGDGVDSVVGGAGTDTLQMPLARSAYSVRRSGSDYQLVRGSDSVLLQQMELVQFADTVMAVSALAAFVEQVISGTEGSDTLVGGQGGDSIEGLGGDDRLDARAGDDRLDGGAGNDRLLPGAGSDTVQGGAGFDLVDYTGLSSGVLVDLVSGFVIEPGGIDQLSAVEGAVGTALGDRFAGDVHDNLFIGGAGDDVFVASGGIDTISYDDPEIADGTGIVLTLPSGPSSPGSAQDGRAGVDTIAFGAAEMVQGSRGPDSITGAPFGVFDSQTIGHDTLSGGAGNDTLRGLSGNDSLLGGDGDDVLIPDDGVDTAVGGAGHDTLQLALGSGAYEVRRVGDDYQLVRGVHSVLLQQIEQVQFADTLLSLAALDALVGVVVNGTDGADTLTAGPGNDTLSGMAGNDLLRPGAGSDSVDGGAGVDTVDYGALAGPVVVELALQRSSVEPGGGSDVLLAIEAVRGSAFADRLVGDGADNRLEGGAGNDTLEGAAGDDTLLGGDGNDTLITGIGSDSLDGGAGADTVQLASGLAGWIATLIGDDLLLERSGGFAAQAVAIGGGGPSVRPAAGGVDSVLLQGIEQVRFSDTTLSFAQLVQSAARSVTGTPGRDTLEGGNGNDTLRGLGDNDVLIDGPGSDRLDGGEGLDIAAFAGVGPVSLNLVAGSATRGLDTDTLVAVEAVFGGDGNDTLRGANAPDHQRSDTLRGRGGNDSIDGASGNDSAEWTGLRSDYTVTRIAPGVWQVRDDNPADGSEGIDTVTGIERLVFADRMLSFGPRAEELARVAFVLWNPAIIGSGALFSRGLSFYDVGYDFETLSVVALQFWTGEGDEQLAQRLISNSGSTKTVAQLLQTMALAGPGIPGRAAAVRDIALDAATTTLIEQSGIREAGLPSDHFVPGFGSLFGLLPGG